MARKRRRVKAKKDEQKPTTGGYAFVEKDVEQTSEKPAVKPKAEDKKTEAKAAPPKATAKKASSSGQRMGSFLRDVRAEVKKVNWPDQERTTQSTGVVIFTLLVLAGFMTLFTMLFTQIAGYLFS